MLRSRFSSLIRINKHIGSLLAVRNKQASEFASTYSNSNEFFHVATRHLHLSTSLYEELVQYKLSDIGEGITEVVIKEWFVKVGDHVNQFDPICEVQSDKASVTISSRYDGAIQKLYYDVDDTARVGLPLVEVKVSGDGKSEKEPHSVFPDEDEEAKVPDLTDEKVLATPTVRKLARENNIRLKDVKGTGRDGRVMKEDIVAHIEFLKTKVEEKLFPKAEIIPPSPITPQPAKVQVKESPAKIRQITILNDDVTVPIRGVRKTMVKTMTEALLIPHFSYSDEFLVNELINARNFVKPEAEKRGVKLSYLPFLIKAVSLALRDYPMLNAHTDAKCENLIHRASHNISVAVDSEHGLIVPNIKRVQNKSILEIAQELSRLQAAAVNSQLSPDDLKGSTFTLSNIGSIGGTYAAPVILPPTVAICALGRIQKLPRYDENSNLFPANVLNVSFSADHRVVDGATIARFSNKWKSYVENPSAMLLDLI